MSRLQGRWFNGPLGSQPLSSSKSRTNIRNRQPVIPQIKIELDEMLSEAFNEMNAQPHKNSILGPTDVYVLDQRLLKAYVQCIYSQYGIQDPLALWAHNAADPPPEHCLAGPVQGFITPEKGGKPRKDPSATTLKTNKWSNKTTERISKLKEKFQSQLRSSSTSLHDHPLRRKAKADDGTQMNPRDNRVEAGRLSHLLPMNHFKYCLMCEKPIEADLITEHEKSCKKLEKLLSMTNLQIRQILQILDGKIEKIKYELLMQQRELNGDADKIREIIRGEIDKGNTCEARDEASLFTTFSTLKTIQCLESLDKLRWFRKMRIKAELKKEYLNHEV